MHRSELSTSIDYNEHTVGHGDHTGGASLDELSSQLELFLSAKPAAGQGIHLICTDINIHSL